jgi:hypothetical protein
MKPASSRETEHEQKISHLHVNVEKVHASLQCIVERISDLIEAVVALVQGIGTRRRAQGQRQPIANQIMRLTG